MSDRLTTNWTERAEEAFGEMGKRGDQGETAVVSPLREIFPDAEIIHHPSDYQLQINGIDITINGLGIDVKTNLRTGRDVVVEKPKLMKSKATFWIHLNLEDKNDFVIYLVEKMKQQVAHLPGWGKDNLVFVPRKDIP